MFSIFWSWPPFVRLCGRRSIFNHFDYDRFPLGSPRKRKVQWRCFQEAVFVSHKPCPSNMLSYTWSQKTITKVVTKYHKSPWTPWTVEWIVKFENTWIFLWHMISRCGELNILDARNKRCTGASFALSDRTRDSQGLAWCAMWEKLPRISVKLKPKSSNLPGQIIELYRFQEVTFIAYVSFQNVLHWCVCHWKPCLRLHPSSVLWRIHSLIGPKGMRPT